MITYITYINQNETNRLKAFSFNQTLFLSIVDYLLS